MSLASQYFNYKAAQQEYQNPLLNGLQMGVMLSGSAKLFDQSGGFNPDLGTVGMAGLCGVAVALDDMLMQRGFTSKHYLTDAVSTVGVGLRIQEILSGSTVQSIVENAVPIAMFGSCALLGIKYLQESFTGSQGLISTMRHMQLRLNKSMNEIEYVTDGTVNASAAIITQSLAEKGMDSAPIPLQVRSIISSFIGQFIASAASSHGLSKIQERNKKIFEDPNSLLKISFDEKQSDVLRSLDNKTFESANALSSVLSLNSGLIKTNNASASTPGFFYLFNLRNLIGELYNSSCTIKTQEELNRCVTAGEKMKHALTNNPRTIVERSGLPYFSHKNAEIETRQQELNDEQQQNALKGCILFFGNFVEGFLTGLVLSSSESQAFAQFISSFMFAEEVWSQSGIAKSELSLKQLASLHKFLETVQNTSFVDYSAYSYSQVNGIYVKGLVIKINGVEKLHMDDLFLESGQWYLLTGKTGCGKTTLMSTLRGLPNFAEAIEIRGEAFYPKMTDNGKPQIYMLTQNNNFPYMVSILEAILYPMVTTEEERVSYKTLVEEIMLRMEGFTRTSVEGQEYLGTGLLSRLFEVEADIYSVTSGGQQKKMALTGLIVKIMKETGMLEIYNQHVATGSSHDYAMEAARNSSGPVLVLLDEVFNGLDSGMSSNGLALSSKGFAIKTLKESLPSKAIVVSVEHQGQLDQYNHRLHLNGDGTYDFTNPKTGNVESIPSFDTRSLPVEPFDPFEEMIAIEVNS